VSNASSEATILSVTREFLNILYNPKVHYRVHKSPPLFPTPSQIDPVPYNPIYLSEIHFNNIPPTYRTSKLFHCFFFFCQILYVALSNACYIPCLPHSPWLDNSRYILRKVKLFIMQFSSSSCYFIPLCSKYSLQNCTCAMSG
jgi:hypothetical protein